MTIAEVEGEKWIHSADGSLKPDNPFITAGTKVKVVRRDPDWGIEMQDAIGIITEEAVELNKKYGRDSKRRHRLYAVWTKANGTRVGMDWVFRKSVDVL